VYGLRSGCSMRGRVDHHQPDRAFGTQESGPAEKEGHTAASMGRDAPCPVSGTIFRVRLLIRESNSCETTRARYRGRRGQAATVSNRGTPVAGIHAKGYTEPHGKDQKPQKSRAFGVLSEFPSLSASLLFSAVRVSRVAASPYCRTPAVRLSAPAHPVAARGHQAEPQEAVRIYRGERLTVCRRRDRKRALGTRGPLGCRRARSSAGPSTSSLTLCRQQTWSALARN